MRTNARRHRNWSGSVRFSPQQVRRPTSEAQVLEALRTARERGCSLRVIGGGHSFSALAATDGILLSLDDWQGLVAADATTGLVTLRDRRQQLR